jgi:hypothetical protein
LPSISFQINPHAVLGITPHATLQEIREAYRQRAKKYHPDAGGEEWAFRILVQSYEMLSTARVARASEAEARPRPEPPTAAAAAAATETSGPGGPPDPEATETIRPGGQDQVADPFTIVDVEKLWIRFEIEHAWILQGGSHADRFLSCSLNIAWPDPALAPRDRAIPDGDRILRALTEVFEEMRVQTRVISARSQVEERQFAGWLSYPTADRAWVAFTRLRDALHARGLGLRHWTRDVIIPRDWR